MDKQIEFECNFENLIRRDHYYTDDFNNTKTNGEQHNKILFND